MNRRKAFTLVELLVVIGIIAVLVGILLPSMNAARRSSQSVKCLASLREIGLGFNMYALAYNGRWPMAVHDAYPPTQTIAGKLNTLPLPTGNSLRWQDRILPFVAGTEGLVLNDFNDLQTHYLDDRFRKSSVLWGCPAYKLMSGYNNLNLKEDQVRSGYVMNPYTLRPEDADFQTKAFHNSTFQGVYYKETIWKRPHGGTTRILMGEGLTHYLDIAPAVRNGAMDPAAGHTFMPFDGTGAGWNASFMIDSTRHGSSKTSKAQAYNGRFSNALFCDGHAEQVSVREAYNAICWPGQNIAVAWP